MEILSTSFDPKAGTQCAHIIECRMAASIAKTFRPVYLQQSARSVALRKAAELAAHRQLIEDEKAAAAEEARLA